MNLDISNAELLKIKSSGRRISVPHPVSVRPLSSEEVAARGASAGKSGPPSSPLQRLNSRHRQLARLIASGTSVKHAAMITGLTPVHVYNLISYDPSFKDLVAHYEALKDAAYMGLHEALVGLSEDATEELRSRIEANPDGFEVKELMQLVQLTADRTGHGPKRTEEKNVNINWGDQLEEARQRARAALQQNNLILEGEIIDGS